MESSKCPQSEKMDASKIEEFLNAVRDIQSVHFDNIWPHLSQGSQHFYPGETLSHPSLRSLESQNESLKKELEKEKEFKQEYFKVFGKKEMKDVNRTMDHMEDEIKRLQEENTKLHETNKRLEEDLRKAITEKDNAMTRFNQEMKIRVIDTDISDMCDQTRTNKLGERYRNFYDTLWTDAFDVLTERKRCTEKDATEILLKMLIECHNFAKMRARKQMTELVQVISGDPTMQAGDEITGQLKAARKLMKVASTGLLYQECENHVKDRYQIYRLYLYEKEVKMYLIECFQVCWLMAIQDPPVVLGKEARYNDYFNADLYKPYTTSGNKVDFVVLPPLLLHEGGPLLERGVAQSRKEPSETMKIYGNAKNNENRIGKNERPIENNTDDYYAKLSTMTRTPIINDVRQNTYLAPTTIPFTSRNQPSTTTLFQSTPTSYTTELVSTSYKQTSPADLGVNMAISPMPNASPTHESWNKPNQTQQGNSRYDSSSSSMTARELVNRITQSTYVPSPHAGTRYDRQMTSQFQSTTDRFDDDTRGHLNSTG